MADLIESLGRTLVIAPHPDDEVLGAGGTIARLSAAGQEVYVAIVTSGRPPLFSAEGAARVEAEAKQAHDLLGVRKTHWLGQPAAQLSETPSAVLNAAIQNVVNDIAPETLLIPFLGDVHIDHQLVFRSTMVAARPHQRAYPRTILAYETLSETNWNAAYLTGGFVPNVFVEIENFLSTKLSAMQKFTSQLRESPHERSIKALTALANLRGAAIHRDAAEGFVMVRHVI